MINDILDFSQISNGSLRLNYEDFSLVNMIKDISKLIKFQAKNKGLKFIFRNNIEPIDQIARIISDQNRLKQVILNLLGNALKFTQSGLIEISVSKAKGNEKKFLIEVRDTGCGIADEDKPKLFQLFGKLEKPDQIQNNPTGVGLGLAISQNLVRLMNNNVPDEEIKVVSEVGSGSCFYFNIISQETFDGRNSLEIPSERSFDENNLEFSKFGDPNGDSVNQSVEKSKDKKVTKILVVDDDQINIMVMNTYLKSFDSFKFDCVFNGKQALEKLEAQAANRFFYDLIIMDCNMPVMDGFQATRRIRKMVNDGILPDITIIASTANTSPTDYEQCFLAGMNDYISKPFSKDDLKSILSKWMTRK
jgi:CheY-like chemotaxis protein